MDKQKAVRHSASRELCGVTLNNHYAVIRLYHAIIGLSIAILYLRQYRSMIVMQLRRRIFRQTIQIEEARATPLPTKFAKYDGKDASKCPSKTLAVHPAVLH